MKTIEEKNKELKTTLDLLNKEVKELFEEKKFREYLNTMEKLHGYSFKNILLLQMQNPKVSNLQNLKNWHAIGRKVNKGEKPYKLLAPYKNRKSIEYCVIPVYDISQTNGREIKTLKFNDDQMKQDLVYSKLYDYEIDNNVKDLKVKSTTYVVAQHFGMDTSRYSFRDINEWSKDKDIKELESSLEAVQRAANNIITEIEEKLEKSLENNKEKDVLIEKAKEEKSVRYPYVEMIFSEVEDKAYFKPGEKIPFNEANTRFEQAEKEVRAKKEEAKKNNELYPYLKTQLALHIAKDTEVAMRYDVGDHSCNDLKEFCRKKSIEMEQVLGLEREVSTDEKEIKSLGNLVNGFKGFCEENCTEKQQKKSLKQSVSKNNEFELER